MAAGRMEKAGGKGLQRKSTKVGVARTGGA